MSQYNPIAVKGNLARIQALLRRAEKGEKLCIGFLGGSITAGSGAEPRENCYAHRVYQWWKEHFPNSEFTYANAGIGATGSNFGCARMGEDLLSHDPDFVVIDFSVNDDRDTLWGETYEGVLRRIYSHKTEPAMIILNTIDYHNGYTAQEVDNRLGAHYGIPCISTRDSLYQQVQDGVYDVYDITVDMLHPNNEGHRLIAKMITDYLEAAGSAAPETQPPYPAPLTRNRFEYAKRLRGSNSEPELNGFSVDPNRQTDIEDFPKQGWTADAPGASVRFELECSCVLVQYVRRKDHPNPIAHVIIDGDMEHAFKLDANFDKEWGDVMAMAIALDDEEKKPHTVEVRITERPEEIAWPFYLLSLITD